ncbi:MAG: hypothetical protein DRP76_04970, partial [Candidatus Omnitrophota bacterium]
MKKLIILLVIIFLFILTGKAEEVLLSSQELKKDISSVEEKGFFNWINKNAYAKSVKEDKKLL